MPPDRKTREQQCYGRSVRASTVVQRVPSVNRCCLLSVCLLVCTGASLTFSSKILDGFYYQFDKGDRIGIVGGNGVGKTTFLNVLMGNQPLDEGEVVTGETVRCSLPIQ